MTIIEMAKTNEVRRYASLIGSRFRSLVRKRFQFFLVRAKATLFFLLSLVDFLFRTQTLDTVVKGFGADLDMGEHAPSSESSSHGCIGAHCCIVCRTGVIDGAGVEGGVTVWLSEHSAVT